MNLTTVDHITINVIDMQKSTAFYKDVMQLPQLDCVDMGDHIIQYFDLGNGIKLELILYKSDSETVKNVPAAPGIYRHMALAANNIEDLFKKIKNAHVKILSPLASCRLLHFDNFLIEDPNGVEIEILHRWS
jgi:catechol 2,3-dioxygenase-like lactoylglutathione lyase family enzyme